MSFFFPVPGFLFGVSHQSPAFLHGVTKIFDFLKESLIVRKYSGNLTKIKNSEGTDEMKNAFTKISLLLRTLFTHLSMLETLLSKV